MASPKVALCAWLVLAFTLTAFTAPVQVSYHWHLQQPIYWPAPIPSDNNTYQKAWQSMQLQDQQGGHPQSDLNDAFGKDDRVAVYQSRAADSINSIGNCCPDAGAQVSYSGCLIENVDSLAGNYGGYNPDWNATYAKFMSTQRTSGGFPKLDFVSFTHHHALGPLIDESALAMEVEIHKVIYSSVWGGAPYSKGFFPAEMAFSERMIPTLVKAGIEWVIVPNNHLSRACKNYTFSPSGDNNDPPNGADQVNPSQENWFSQSISRGCTPNNAVPFAYRPHKAQYVDPESGKVYSITVVPSAMAMSWDDGYACYDTSDIDSIAAHNEDDHPMLILLAHDGVPQLMNQAASKGYHPTTIQQYLTDYPVDENDVVHVEDGAWVNADSDFGAPQFVNWDWPLLNRTGGFDIPNGWAVRERNWAVITAAQNFVNHAETITGPVRPSEVQKPSSSATEAEIAWHFFLPSLTSGYMYYGAILVKQTIACNTAIDHARKALETANARDQTPPSVWALQRLPWNPGGYGAGSLWHYEMTKMSTDFYVWTFVYDVSGVQSVNFYYRIDDDGVNPIDDSANELYRPPRASGVSDWKELSMRHRAFPAGNVYNQSSIDFFVMPDAIADEYYVCVQGLSNVLIDYYVEATDKAGNTKKTDIYHVKIEE